MIKTISIVAMLAVSFNSRADDSAYWTNVATGAAMGAAGGFALSFATQDTKDLQRWTFGDTAMELAFAAVTTIDMMQTVSFRNKGWYEANPILGRTPSSERVILTISGCIISHAIIAYLLPHPWRSIWQGMWIGVEVDAVGHNFSTKAGLTTPW